MAVPIEMPDDADECQNIKILMEELLVNIHLMFVRRQNENMLLRQRGIHPSSTSTPRTRVRRVGSVPPVPPMTHLPTPANETSAQHPRLPLPEAVPIVNAAKVVDPPNIWVQTGVELRRLADKHLEQIDKTNTSDKSPHARLKTTIFALLNPGFNCSLWTTMAVLLGLHVFWGKR